MPRLSDENARLKRARRRGYEDRMAGVLQVMNPYKAADTRCHWNDGWLEADEEIEASTAPIGGLDLKSHK
ncbi:MAG: ribosome modulation factor [Thermodesulfobacteriota bacterium]